MSDRMLEICSGFVFVLIVFTIFLVLVGWLQPVLNFAKGVGDVILVIGGSGTSILGLRIRNRSRSYASLYDKEDW